MSFKPFSVFLQKFSLSLEFLQMFDEIV